MFKACQLFCINAAHANLKNILVFNTHTLINVVIYVVYMNGDSRVKVDEAGDSVVLNPLKYEEKKAEKKKKVNKINADGPFLVELLFCFSFKC